MHTDNTNILAVEFDDGSKAYEALSKLKQLDAQGQVELAEGAVVVRGEDGTIEIKDRIDGAHFAGTATGGVIGLLVGVLGGPFGLLIGGTYGLLVGSLFDMDDREESDSALARISSTLHPDQTVVLAEVTEPSKEVIDSAMHDLGGTVQRWLLDDVEAEIAAAESAERRANREARKALAEQRRTQAKENTRAKLDQLKAKLQKAAA